MTLDQLITDLQKLQAEGHGSKTVLGCDSNNGSYGMITGGSVSEEFGDMGPFDIPEGTAYIELGVGL